MGQIPDGMVMIPWWHPWLSTIVMVAVLSASALFDRWSRRRLAEAVDYWRRSDDIWARIDAVPDARITEDVMEAMEDFVSNEVDQVGSIPSDYYRWQGK